MDRIFYDRFPLLENSGWDSAVSTNAAYFETVGELKETVEKLAPNCFKSSCWDGPGRYILQAFYNEAQCYGRDVGRDAVVLSEKRLRAWLDMFENNVMMPGKEGKHAVKLQTDCRRCLHKETCRWKDNAEDAVEKLKDDVYGWDARLGHLHVDVVLSCPDYEHE